MWLTNLISVGYRTPVLAASHRAAAARERFQRFGFQQPLRNAVALLGLALARCAATNAQSNDCDAALKSWNVHLKALPPGPAVKRIHDIQTLAATFNDADAQCVSNEVDKALETEQKELIQLTVAGRAVKPHAVYSCRTLTQDLVCNADIADATVHLGENPNAVYLHVPPGKTKLFFASGMDENTVRIYLADENNLHDKPRYVRVSLRRRTLEVPAITSKSVLIAVFKEPAGGGIMDKAVWLLFPNAAARF